MQDSVFWCFFFLQYQAFSNPMLHPVIDGSGQINQAGVDHYNKLINALIAKGSYQLETAYILPKLPSCWIMNMEIAHRVQSLRIFLFGYFIVFDLQIGWSLIS